MEDQPSLLQPLILHERPTSTTALSTNDNEIFIRFLFIIFIGFLALYANHEASKGFNVTVINDVGDSAAGRRFDLFYVSNDKAIHLILDASNFVEHLLYSENARHQEPKKRINHVVLMFSSGVNLTSKQENDRFVLHISPSIMDRPNAEQALVTAIIRGMARIWLWDGKAKAPPELIDGMVEYTRMKYEGSFGHSTSYGTGTKLAECDKFWWKDRDTKVVAHLLNYYEGHSKGFIQQLNGAMKEKWHDRMVDDALGNPMQNLCSALESDWT